MEIQNSLEKEYKIRSCEVDYKDNIKPSALLSLMEDIAYLSAENLGFGYSNVYDKNLAWFVVKYKVKIFEKIEAWENINFKTWPSEFKGIKCRREFEINKNNKKIMQGTSLWAVIDIKNKRPVVPYKVLNFPPLSRYKTFEDELKKIENIERVDISKEFEILKSDIDLNMHVNNSNYIMWAIETLPYKIIDDKFIEEFEIDFKKDIVLENKKVKVEVQIEENYATSSIKTMENIECATIKIKWR